MEEKDNKVSNRGSPEFLSAVNSNMLSSSVVLESLSIINESVLALGNTTKTANSKLDKIIERINKIEAENRERDLSLLEITCRVQSLELNQSLEDAKGDLDWQPQSNIATKVLLLGDSNSAGKIRFGEERGTLGKHLPGQSLFIATASHLPEIDLFPEWFEGVTDLIIAIGTNDLKNYQSASSCPKTLAKNIYRYCRLVIDFYSSIQISLPAVPPTRNWTLNVKIDEYNRYLQDMCRKHPNLEYVHMRGMKGDDNLLLTRLQDKEVGTGLHLNDQGLKIYASRLKAALREKHYLPVFSPRRGGRVNRGKQGIKS